MLATLGCSWPALGVLLATLGRSWAALGRSWVALGRSWAALGTTPKNHQKIDAKNDRFGPPKASQNDPKIGPKNDQKSMPKTKRKKNRNKTKITPSETQKSLKNQWKINKNQKITYTHFDPIWGPKTPQNRTPKRPKNEQKNNPKKHPKKDRKKRPTWLQNGPKMAPQNGQKTIKKTRRNYSTGEPHMCIFFFCIILVGPLVMQIDASDCLVACWRTRRNPLQESASRIHLRNSLQEPAWSSASGTRLRTLP